MKFKTVLITIIAGFLFTAFVYNIGVISTGLFELFGLDATNPFVNHYSQFINSYLFLYSSITIFYFILYRIVYKQCNVKNDFNIAILCIATPILLDATVLIGNQSLIPLRFPFSSIFPIIGVVFAILLVKNKTTIFYFSLIPLVLFFYLTDQMIVPTIIYNSIEKETSDMPEDDFSEYTFLTKDGVPVKLKDISNYKCTLIETYFIGCAACEEKKEALKIVSEKFQNKSFVLINICDGKISTFNSFKKHLPKNNSTKELYLYDFGGIVRNQLKIDAYPTELILNKNRIVSKKIGFETMIIDLYVNDEIATINSILNE